MVIFKVAAAFAYGVVSYLLIGLILTLMGMFVYNWFLPINYSEHATILGWAYVAVVVSLFLLTAAAEVFRSRRKHGHRH